MMMQVNGGSLMGKQVELERIPIKTSSGEVVGHTVIVVDLDELKSQVKDQDVKALEQMGYTKYQSVLEKEGVVWQ